MTTHKLTIKKPCYRKFFFKQYLGLAVNQHNNHRHQKLYLKDQWILSNQYNDQFFQQKNKIERYLFNPKKLDWKNTKTRKIFLDIFQLSLLNQIPFFNKMINISSKSSSLQRNAIENYSNSSIFQKNHIQRRFTLQKSQHSRNYESFKSQQDAKPSSMVSVDISAKPHQKDLATKDCSPIQVMQKLNFPKKINNPIFSQIYLENFKRALNVSFNQRNQKQLRENMGISIVDFKGNFIWADKLSQSLFEIKVTPKSQIRNLFSLMINLSKFKLLKRFNGKFLMNQNHTKRRFTYCIYSKEKKKKLIKKMRQNKSYGKSFQQGHKYYDTQIFFKYLNALSTEAQLVRIKVPFKYIINPNKAKLKNIKLDRIVSQETQNFDDSNKEILSQYYFFNAILLKTRVAKRIPNYKYQSMINDKMIIKFEKDVMNSFKQYNYYIYFLN